MYFCIPILKHANIILSYTYTQIIIDKEYFKAITCYILLKSKNISKPNVIDESFYNIEDIFMAPFWHCLAIFFSRDHLQLTKGGLYIKIWRNRGHDFEGANWLSNLMVTIFLISFSLVKKPYFQDKRMSYISFFQQFFLEEYVFFHFKCGLHG